MKNRLIKIYVDAYLLNKEPQGTKTYIKELYKEYANQNPSHQIYLGCFKDELIVKEFSEYKNIHFVFLKQKSRAIRMLFEIPKFIKKHRFDFAHFQYVIPFKKVKGCKYIVTIHDILFNDFTAYFSKIYKLKRNFLFKFSAKKSDILLTVSNYSKERINKIYNLKNKEITIILNGVSKSFLKEYDKEGSKKYIKNKYGIENYILYVSRIEPRKNQELLLEAFLKLNRKDLSLVFLGKETIENSRLNKLKANLSSKQKESIHFLEGIENNEILEFYRASKLFVYPSLAEGFGIPPIEAGALKTPVLCSNKTAMQDFSFFKPFFIDVDDKKLFQEKLNKLLITLNQENLESIKSIISERFTWEQSAKKLYKTLEQHL